MLKKEGNQLKRGRIQGQSRELKKISVVGEVSDPFIVLNDSISMNNRPPDCENGDYIPSEKPAYSSKTTTVDALDPLSDPIDDPTLTTETRNPYNERLPQNERPRNPHRNNDRPTNRYSQEKREVFSNYDRPTNRYSQEKREAFSNNDHPTNRYSQEKREAFTTYPKTKCHHTQNSCSEEKKCPSCLCSIKNFLYKILNRLGLKSNPSCDSCHTKVNDEFLEQKKLSNNNRRPPARGGNNTRNHPNGRSHRPRPPSKNF
jgi:hypothetical protein